jgi:hypothetical protein
MNGIACPHTRAGSEKERERTATQKIVRGMEPKTSREAQKI